MLRFFSVRTQLIISLVLCATLALTAASLIGSRQPAWVYWLGAWLIAANLVAFAYYGFDKYLARRWMIVRVPERVLHALAAVGGSPGALLAMWVFRHKTIKGSFQIVFWCILILQVAVASYIVKIVWWA